jgi:hypothetical protein
MPDHLFEGKLSDHLSDEELTGFFLSKAPNAALNVMIRPNCLKRK